MRGWRTVPVAIVLVAAGCGGGGSGETADVDADVTVAGTDALAFEPSEVSVESGQRLALTCEAANHTLVLSDGDEELLACPSEGADAATVELDADTYEFYCDVPGHQDAGMEGTLTVEE